MQFNLFIDDERFPADDGKRWFIARNMGEVKFLISWFGMPNLISFDHDLGENEPTGYDIAKELVRMDMDNEFKFPGNFWFDVHSQNPIGKKNIEMYFYSYFDHIEK